VKLLANENFPLASILFLRGIGYDITSIGEDYSGISDRVVMEIAEAEQRTILTFDRDYGELIYKYSYKPQRGIIYLRLSQYEPDAPGKIIHELLDIQKVNTERSLTVFDGWTIRQRKY
jgi:predicted nuclease of predicted toxin-antitoxin system